jgi:Fur family ferric uptake transcriptional regulator
MAYLQLNSHDFTKLYAEKAKKIAMSHNELKKAGLKTTLPRLRILQLLESSPNHHLSAEEIYKTLSDCDEDVGLATVYRVLTQFEAAGMVIRHRFEGNSTAVFELNERNHHDHLLCIDCGAVIEFTDKIIEQRQNEIAAQHGFILNDHCLYLYGKCQNPQTCSRNHK